MTAKKPNALPRAESLRRATKASAAKRRGKGIPFFAKIAAERSRKKTEAERWRWWEKHRPYHGE